MIIVSTYYDYYYYYHYDLQHTHQHPATIWKGTYIQRENYTYLLALEIIIIIMTIIVGKLLWFSPGIIRVNVCKCQCHHQRVHIEHGRVCDV